MTSSLFPKYAHCCADKQGCALKIHVTLSQVVAL